ncbi:MAG: 6-phosphogluconolactonase [Myxococcota bacterium]
MPSTAESQIGLHQYENLQAMGDQLAARITRVVEEAVDQRGHATLAVSGGSTPKALYARLTHLKASWNRVVIVLVDERWVEPGSPGSNETFVRDHLMQGEVKAARFIGLKTAGETPDDGLQEAETRLRDASDPFDVVLLGMGTDGHTASWFPHAQGLKEAISPTGARVAAIEANRSDVTGPFTQRMTLTRASLAGAPEIHLLLSGAEKRQTWEDAMGPGEIEDMPIRALLRDPEITLQAHWAP